MTGTRECSHSRGTRARRLTPVCWFGLAGVVLLAVGCATAFSPATIRNEIVRQTGSDPQGVFELSLGRPTMALAKRVLGSIDTEGPLPLAGISAFEMAVYEVPEEASNLDFTRMPVRGWEPVVKIRKAPNSAFVLIRPYGEVIGDLVLVAAGADQVLYARIRGSLSKDLPDALGNVVAEGGGPDVVRRELLSLTGETSGESPASPPSQ